METRHIQKIQEEYDKEYPEHKDSNLEKIRRITSHMGTLLGKLSSYCEQEHETNYSNEQIKNEVIPDLIVYSAKLSNITRVDLGDVYIKRISEIQEKMRGYKNE